MSNSPDVVIAITLSDVIRPTEFKLLKSIVSGILNSLDSEQEFSLIAFNQDIIGFKAGEFQSAAAIPDAWDWLEHLAGHGQADLGTLDMLLGRVAQLPNLPATVVLAGGRLPRAVSQVQPRKLQGGLWIASVGSDQTELARWGCSIGAKVVPADAQQISEEIKRLANRPTSERLPYPPQPPRPQPNSPRPQPRDPGQIPDVVLAISNSGQIDDFSFLRLKSLASEVLSNLSPHQQFALIAFNDELSGFQNGVHCRMQELSGALNWLNELRKGPEQAHNLLFTLEILLSRIEYVEPSTLVFVLLAGGLGTQIGQLQHRSSLVGRLFLVGIDIDPIALSAVRKAIGAQILPPTCDQIFQRIAHPSD